jgi:hypothetical protein
MRLSGVTGRWVFWQDSSRPEADFMPAYSTHRDASEKPEKEFGFFSRPDFSSLKRVFDLKRPLAPAVGLYI